MLAGGSAFGLEAANGVMRFLEENGVGYETGAARIPIVPSAILYDLGIGNPNIRPDDHMGYLASKNASTKPSKEGNIGAGKSTFLNILRQNLEVDIIFEPTDKWQNIGTGGNLLDLFYKDTKRWAYTFQSYAFITRVESVLEHQAKSANKNVQILERSVYCDRYCFAKNCFEHGNMSALEWQIYKEWFL